MPSALDNIVGMNEWQFLAALAVPVFGLFGALLQRERTPGQLRRLRDVATAMKDLDPKSDAHGALSELVTVQARAMIARESRQVNVTNVILSSILAGFAGWGTYGLTLWCISTWATPFGWLALTVSIIVGLGLMLIVGAAFGTIYNPKSEPRAKTPTNG